MIPRHAPPSLVVVDPTLFQIVDLFVLVFLLLVRLLIIIIIKTNPMIDLILVALFVLAVPYFLLLLLLLAVFNLWFLIAIRFLHLHPFH